ncbi:uncharacterized protein LOC143582525 [Bidens hawaiensis]|uniref:uncharacterized protein LOC143582525 n=1 Tax=Bidens hawaiensis TaxID=980011 RepID=UPI00404AE9AB
MLGWIHITLVAASAGIILFLLFFLFKYIFSHPKPPPPPAENTTVSRHETTSKKLTLFKWSDNPTLITDAIENGWSRFAFTDYISSSSVGSSRFLLGSCAGGAGGVDGSGEYEDDVEISWEVCPGSADFMQKIRFNSGLKKIIKTTTSAMSAASVIRSALPLPGPEVGNTSPFPQEAYFEITILSCYESEDGKGVNGKGGVNIGEDENIMLIQENGVNGRGGNVNMEELRGRGCVKEIGGGGNEVSVMLSVGFTVGGPLPVKLPGSYPRSIGFYSDGSIYLDGNKLIIESNIERWERSDKVIGCGYNPNLKKVFFAVDSKLVHEINCKGDEFGTPLYPVLATNSDVVVLVNFGQSVFKYGPANFQRTQNPCFIGPMATSSSSGYEDSKELFSMGNIDSQWLNQTARSGSYHANVNKGKMKECDEASEGDLFEIMIESNSYRKSPSILSKP